MQSNHDIPSTNTKLEGVCICYKELSCICLIDIPNLAESALFQVTLNDKTDLDIYHSPPPS